jgi:predicted dehydrogenase
MNFKILIIGLGSMGKRRIRNLKALQQTEITGFDLREDRCKEAAEKYDVKTFTSFEKAFEISDPDVLIISVPPDAHHIYMKIALEKKKPAFVEASVVDEDLEKIMAQAKEQGILIAPSYTFYFHPAVQRIQQFINDKYLGNVSNIIYHSGQYLPDWHTYEKVEAYYVSKKETGGAREIVPFELTWLIKIFGFPKSVVGQYKKTIHIEGAENIEDTYNALLDFDNFLMSFTVDVVSRVHTRRLIINGDEKQLYWYWDENLIKVFNPQTNIWEEYPYETLNAEPGYTKNITEQMYIDEIQTFLDAVNGKPGFDNTLENDHKILKLLYAIERSYDEKKFIEII